MRADVVGIQAALRDALADDPAHNVARVLAGLDPGRKAELVRHLLPGNPTKSFNTDVEGFPALVRTLDAPDPPPIDWIVPGLIPAGMPGLWVGPAGAGKDSTFLALAVAVATGTAPWGHLPWTAVHQRDVVVVSAEDPRSMMLSRLHALVRGAGVDHREALGRIHILSAEDSPTLDSEAWGQHLVEEVARVDAGLVMLGPLRDMMSGSENDSEAVAPIIRRIRSICSRTGAAVALNHHAGKPRENTSRSDRIRGSSALHGMARWAMWVEGAPNGRIVMDLLKLNVAALPPSFLLEREIQVGTDGSWHRATFTYVPAREADRTDAERAIREVLRSAPGSTTTQLRDYLWKGYQISPKDAAAAIKAMEEFGIIGHESGARGSKLWHLAGASSQADAAEEIEDAA